MGQPSELTNHIKQILCDLLAGTEWDAWVNFQILLCIIPAAPGEKRKRQRIRSSFKKVSEVNSVLDNLKDKH